MAVGDLGQPAVAVQPDPPTPYVMPRGLVSPGLVHVLNNMVAEADKALDGWGGWLTGLKALSHLLHRDHLRQRFVATC
eukprot:14664468-Alexandrium_andersonii.AAC.1